MVIIRYEWVLLVQETLIGYYWPILVADISGYLSEVTFNFGGWKAMVWTWLRLEFTLWLFNIAVENGPFIDDFPIKTSIYKWFSMAMLNNQMVQFLWEPWYSILEPKPHLRWTYWWDAAGEEKKGASSGLGAKKQRCFVDYNIYIYIPWFSRKTW